MFDKNKILQILKQEKQKYQHIGINIVGLFGSYAKNKADKFSDIDVAYTIDYDKFSYFYKDGFSKLEQINKIKNSLSSKFKKKVDFVPFKQQYKEIIYV